MLIHLHVQYRCCSMWYLYRLSSNFSSWETFNYRKDILYTFQKPLIFSLHGRFTLFYMMASITVSDFHAAGCLWVWGGNFTLQHLFLSRCESATRPSSIIYSPLPVMHRHSNLFLYRTHTHSYHYTHNQRKLCAWSPHTDTLPRKDVWPWGIITTFFWGLSHFWFLVKISFHRWHSNIQIQLF